MGKRSDVPERGARRSESEHFRVWTRLLCNCLRAVDESASNYRGSELTCFLELPARQGSHGDIMRGFKTLTSHLRGGRWALYVRQFVNGNVIRHFSEK